MPGYPAAVWDEAMNGNPHTAIKSYERIVAEFDAQRGAAAENIYELAETLQKLGQGEEARTQYARLLREFPDFPTLAQIAAARMNEIPAAAVTATFTGASQPNLPVVSQNPVTPQQIAGNPALRQLILDEMKLVEGQVQARQALFQAGVASNDESVPLQRDLLHLRDLLAAADAEEKRSTERPLAAAPTAEAPRVQSGNDSLAQLLRAQVEKRTLEREESRELIEFLENPSANLAALSTQIVKDPRFARLKGEYETALTSGGPDVDQARSALVKWVNMIYLPELHASLDFSTLQLDSLNVKLKKLEDETRGAFGGGGGIESGGGAPKGR
jgi:hypothetical protein